LSYSLAMSRMPKRSTHRPNYKFLADIELPKAKRSVPRPFSLYFELRNKIKIVLNSGRKESPVIRIDMPFDKLQFDGGLKQYGTFVRTFRGIVRCNINHYGDLNVLLGKNWHFRGLNSQGDFCYCRVLSAQASSTARIFPHRRGCTDSVRL